MELFPIKNCDLCSNREGGPYQTPLHLYLDCPTLRNEFHNITGLEKRVLRLDDYLRFFEHIDIRTLFKWDHKPRMLYEEEDDFWDRMAAGTDLVDLYEDEDEEVIEARE